MSVVLIVEDNEMNREVLARRLVRQGYTVLSAVDGEQGMEIARKERPAVILMDMSLPVVDGYEATRQLKADAAMRTTPIIGLSAHAMSGDAEKAMAAGCDDYDTKPIDYARLFAKIEKALSGKPGA